MYLFFFKIISAKFNPYIERSEAYHLFVRKHLYKNVKLKKKCQSIRAIITFSFQCVCIPVWERQDRKAKHQLSYRDHEPSGTFIDLIPPTKIGFTYSNVFGNNPDKEEYLRDISSGYLLIWNVYGKCWSQQLKSK